MRKFLPPLLAMVILLSATPVWAESHYSVGIGGGFGDEDVGPGVLSVKYWQDWIEVGSEIFYEGDTGSDIDQLVMSWLMYRVDLHHEENNTPWVGAGFGYTFEADSYEDDFGFVGAMGWEGERWGMEGKVGYFDPFLYSFVVYWHFN